MASIECRDNKFDYFGCIWLIEKTFEWQEFWLKIIQRALLINVFQCSWYQQQTSFLKANSTIVVDYNNQIAIDFFNSLK